MSPVAKKIPNKTARLWASVGSCIALTAFAASAQAAAAPAPKPIVAVAKAPAPGPKPAAAPAPTAGPTLQQRTAAAVAVATTSQYCKLVAPFYWEIGDKNGAKSSGTGGTGTVAPPNPNALMAIASASKWIFATYVVEKQQGVLSTYDVEHLNMTSGYTNFNACTLSATVSSCLSEAGTAGGSNGAYIAATDNKYYYNGGHMQTLADYIGLGQNNSRALATAVRSVIGSEIPLSYSQPQLAGGGILSPAGYALFLRNILKGKYAHMQKMLGADAVCTHTNSADCRTALYSPANQRAPGAANYASNQAYHYSLGHWVEDDPAHGDGAYSSMGKAGFYPWIDKSKTYYGVLAPNDPKAFTSDFGSQGDPLFCGQAIRRAWISGKASNLNVR